MHISSGAFTELVGLKSVPGPLTGNVLLESRPVKLTRDSSAEMFWTGTESLANLLEKKINYRENFIWFIKVGMISGRAL